MRDSAEAKRCSDCNTEFYSSYYSKPDACKECAVTHDDYTPEVDGEPCADCSPSGTAMTRSSGSTLTPPTGAFSPAVRTSPDAEPLRRDSRLTEQRKGKSND